ncbi:hypothetical protein DFH09DRAFT_1126069 [Mycena vulgaris]|nr:hypothetical protein DFH09DRAFT_1126069 [Mycena vulgaris]
MRVCQRAGRGRCDEGGAGAGGEVLRDGWARVGADAPCTGVHSRVTDEGRKMRAGDGGKGGRSSTARGDRRMGAGARRLRRGFASGGRRHSTPSGSFPDLLSRELPASTVLQFCPGWSCTCAPHGGFIQRRMILRHRTSTSALSPSPPIRVNRSHS